MKACFQAGSSPIHFDRLAILAIAVLGLSNLAMAGEIISSQGAVFDYSRSPQSLIVSYSLHIGEIAEADSGPGLKIYGDGFGYVHYPSYMTRAGDYGFQLNEDEMVELLTSLAADGVLEFDDADARSRARETDTLRRERDGKMRYVSDPSTTEIGIHLATYTPPGATATRAEGVEKVVRWSGLEADARIYPDDPAIQGLADAERMLRTLMERPDLVRAPPRTQRSPSAPPLD